MRLIIGTALLVALPACGYQPPEPQVTVEAAWIQLPVVAGRPGAAYFTLRTNNDPTKLIAVSSPRIERIELHDSSMEAGVMRMRPITDAVFPGEVLRFAPGEKHAMLFGIDPSLRPGDKVSLTFTFEPAPPVTAEADVRAFGAGGHGTH